MVGQIDLLYGHTGKLSLHTNKDGLDRCGPPNAEYILTRLGGCTDKLGHVEPRFESGRITWLGGRVGMYVDGLTDEDGGVQYSDRIRVTVRFESRPGLM
jgi:hypothetical protein